MKSVSRREVIKTFFFGTAISNVIGSSWNAPLVFAMDNPARRRVGLLTLRLSDFPELAQPGGSIRIGTSPVVRFSPNEIRSVGAFQPIIINRGNAGELYVLSAECTHAGCTVRRYNPTTGVMICPCHNSEFLIDGRVRPGFPANSDLYRFTDSEVRQVGDTLEVELTNMFWESPFDPDAGKFVTIRAERVASGQRAQLSFYGLPDVSYEIYFRPTLSAPLERVQFALTADGPLDQTEIAGDAEKALNAFVERPGSFGFFQIAIKTLKLPDTP